MSFLSSSWRFVDVILVVGCACGTTTITIQLSSSSLIESLTRFWCSDVTAVVAERAWLGRFSYWTGRRRQQGFLHSHCVGLGICSSILSHRGIWTRNRNVQIERLFNGSVVHYVQFIVSLTLEIWLSDVAKQKLSLSCGFRSTRWQLYCAQHRKFSEHEIGAAHYHYQWSCHYYYYVVY